MKLAALKNALRIASKLRCVMRAMAGNILARQFGFSLNPPESVQIEISTRCNLSCFMCPRETLGYKKRIIPDMTMEQFDHIIEQLPMRTSNLFLHGLCEPTLHKDILKMVSAAASKSRVILVTNGQLLNDRLMRDLFSASLSGMIISMDSPYKEMYENIRPGADYEKLMENIRLIPEVKRSFPNASFKINMTVSEENFDSINDMIDLCADWNIDELVLLGMHTHCLKKRSELIPNYAERILSIEKYAKAKNVFLSKSTLEYQPGARDKRCDMPWILFYINCDGAVNPCCVHESKSIPIMGNIFSENFNAIWNGRRMRAFRKALLTSKAPEICRNCDYFYK